MKPQDRQFLAEFFRALHQWPLEPDDPKYVHIYDEGGISDEDPVELLARGIEWTPGQSVQLFFGFRGTGKSTELLRLRKRLRESGYRVILIDIEEYINASSPVDVSDFLMALAGAFGESLQAPEMLGKDGTKESYWERLSAFLTRTRVELDELSVGAGEGVSAEIKVTLKSDPTFKAMLQKRMAGHLGALVKDVHDYLRGCVGKLKDRHGQATDVVVLLDSVEHIRGTSVNAREVHDSVETLFAGHADKLHLPNLHVVYTVPTYLKIRYSGIGGLYAPGGLQTHPAIKSRDEKSGEAAATGLEALTKVAAARGDWQRLLESREALDGLSLQSGGNIRDFLRLLAEIIRRTKKLPVDERTIESAVSQIRNENLPIADADALWLDRVARTHEASLANRERIPDLARFLDSHLVLCYHNGHEWFDVHPLVRESVQEQAKRLREEGETEKLSTSESSNES